MSRRPCTLFLLALAAVLGWAAPAMAHEAGVSRGEFELLADGTVRGLEVFAKPDAVRLGEIDANGDGIVAPGELAASERVFRRVVARGVLVLADGRACPGGLEGGGDLEEDGFGLSLRYACPAGASEFEVRVPILSRLGPGHRQLLRVAAGEASDAKTATADDDAVALSLRRDGAVAPRAEADLSPLVRMGIVHVLTGYDHLLFLLALLLGVRRVRSAAIAVTSFTVAHSITLAAGAFGLFTVDPRWVEPAIAASVVLVAAEAWLRPHVEGRGREAFAFGLLHGLAFAGALASLGLARDRLVPSLLAFNVGVEVGQLAVIVPLVPLLLHLRSGPAFERRWLRPASALVGVAGAAILLARLVAS